MDFAQLTSQAQQFQVRAPTLVLSCLFSLSSRFSRSWWPFHIPSTPLIWVGQDACMFNVNVQGPGHEWHVQNLRSETLQLLSVDQLFITLVIAKVWSCCWVYGFPWHYAIHIAGPWAVPAVWSCFMTSCPRAREGDCPFPVRTVQRACTLSAAAALITQDFIWLVCFFFQWVNIYTPCHSAVSPKRCFIHMSEQLSALQMCSWAHIWPPWQVFIFTNKTKYSSLGRLTLTLMSQNDVNRLQ